MTGRAAIRAAAIVVAAALAARRGRFGRRAVLRAAASAAAAAGLSRHRLAAALVGGAVGAGIEHPSLALPLGVAASTAPMAGGHAPAVAAGVLAAVATTRVWPTAPRTVEELRRHGTKSTVEGRPEGEGVALAVNDAAGSADGELPSRLREALPRAAIVDLDDLREVPADAVGAAGGDGTIRAAAAIAHDRGAPLVAVPAGTLNHFARDLGVFGVDDALDAVRGGQLVDVDVGDAGGQVFLNTCSFGAYTELVSAREELEDRIGKWPAVVVALVRVLRRADPIELEVDGRRRRLWLGFIGNGHYRPSGFAPAWREVLDDGVLDLRLVSADRPLARIRLVLSILTGRLGRSTVYEERLTSTVTLHTADEHLTLALDGEVVEVGPSITVHLRPRRLRVFAPHR